MPGCTPPCVEIKLGWSDRQKWNYVKNLYQPNYTIDSNGDEADPRAIDDEARIADFVTWDGQYNDDHTTWITYYSSTPFEKWLQWQYEIGTTVYGNLPQHKKSEHKGHCWMPCPYTSITDSSVERSETMWSGSGAPELSRVAHGIYYMKTQARGSVWGYECTFDGCSYLESTGGVVSGTRYFYV